MAITSVGGVATPVTASTANSLGQDQFLQILLTQLQYQDPLKPLDNQQFIAQLAQFTTLAQTQQLNTKIDTLSTIGASDQAINLLNKTVEVAAGTSSTIGKVTTITFSTGGEPQLAVTASDGSVVTGVSLSQVSIVRP